MQDGERVYQTLYHTPSWPLAGRKPANQGALPDSGAARMRPRAALGVDGHSAGRNQAGPGGTWGRRAPRKARPGTRRPGP